MVKRHSDKPAVRCAIYTRKSTNENLDTDFNSLDAQREACELYIQSQAREGWMVIEEHYDDGAYSGASMDRPAVQRLLDDVGLGKIDVVVVYKIDRLSRNLLEFNQTLNFFDQYKVSFASVTEQFNTQTPMGRFAMNMISSFSQMEREVIAERIRDKVAASKKRGKWMGGTPPLGYNVDRKKKQLVVNDEEANTVRFIFKRFLQLQSAIKLVKELNEKGITTKSWVTKAGKKRKGRSFDKSHIYRMLNNPVYVGKIKHRDQVYPGEHDAIIEKSLWDQVQKAIRSEGKAGTRHSQTPAMLKGILRCGHCKKPMGVTYTKKNGKRYRYYLCQTASKSGYDECPVRTVPAGDIENVVLMQIRRLLGTPEIIAETYRQVQKREEDQIEKLHTEASELKSELQTLEAALSRIGISGKSKDLMLDDRADLESRIANTTQRLAAVEAELAFHDDHPLTELDLAEEINKLDAIWDELFPGERSRLIQMLVDEVIVQEDGLDIIMQKDGVQQLTHELKGDTQSAA